MLSLTRKLVETANLLHITRNRYGDIVYGIPTTLSCLYRDISSLRQIDYKEGISIEGIFWFPPDSTVIRGDVIAYNNEHYRVVKIIQGKRTMLDNSTDFIKVEVNHMRQVS